MKIKKWLRVPIYLVVSSLVLLTAFGLNEWFGKPIFINNFFNRFAIKLALESPETLTSLHVLEPLGITGHNAELDDASPEALTEFFAFIKQESEVLESYDLSDLTEEERISKRVAEYLFDIANQAQPYRFHNYPINQFVGIQNNFPSFMQSQHQVHSKEDARAYISRLSMLPHKFKQVIDGLELRKENGILPPKFVVKRVVDEISAFTKGEVTENILYRSFASKLKSATEITDKEKANLLNKAAQEIETSVFPAYQKLNQYFQSLADIANENVGYWSLPNGDKVYQLALKFFTSTDYTPDYIHNVGLLEVDRIKAEIESILSEQGFEIEPVFIDNITKLSNQERFYYPDTENGREQILADYREIIEEINQGLDSAFNLRPSASVEVERIPKFREKSAAGAYYNPPAVDGSRPGIFYANLYDINATPKYSMRTLAYHEAIPGHHFQIATAQELENLPIFRRFAPFTAYIEGWALYAERLAYELGYQSNPFDNIGRLQAELFRAVRLVVDTGLHAKRWTREEAIEYMLQNTGMARSDVVAEIERYIVMPGQACAYKVGMMKILELRALTKEQLGDDFDLAEFHDVILKNGAIPLDILAELVNNYITDKKRR